MEPNENEQTYKPCAMCGKPLPIFYERKYCPNCEEEATFKEFREYIRTHDATEYELSEVLHVPVSQIRRWIREGRVQYQPPRGHKLVSTTCERCGAPITTGIYCDKCMRIINGPKGHASTNQKPGEGQMRFLHHSK